MTYAGNSQPKSLARRYHWDMAGDVKGYEHIGLAGHQLTDIPEACYYGATPLTLYERNKTAWLRQPKEGVGVVLPNDDIRVHKGDVGSAYLDFCASFNHDTRDCIETIAKLVIPAGIITITLMKGREIPGTYESRLIHESSQLGPTAARLMAVYSILPHTNKHWFKPVKCFEYVGHKAPMMQITFRKEGRVCRASRVSDVCRCIQEIITL